MCLEDHRKRELVFIREKKMVGGGEGCGGNGWYLHVGEGVELRGLAGFDARQAGQGVAACTGDNHGILGRVITAIKGKIQISRHIGWCEWGL